MKSIKELWYNTVFNVFQLTGWILVLYLDFELLKDFADEHVHAAVIFARVVQLFQVTDLITAGVSLPRLMQLSGRLLVLYVFTVRNDTIVFVMLLAFALSDIVRYLYYFLKHLPLMATIRYNLPFLLYPIGFACELVTIEKTLRAEGLDRTWRWYAGRGYQVLGMLGLAYILAHLLRERRAKLGAKVAEPVVEAPMERVRDETAPSTNAAKRRRD